jgi:glucokinase
MKTGLVLGIDIGGTFTKIGLVNRAGKTFGTKVFRTGSQAPFEDFREKLKSEVALLLKGGKDSLPLLAIGVGAPNANTITGQMEQAPNFAWGPAVPLVATIKEWYNLPVYLANDANAAALGELYYGAGKDLDNFVVLTLGTGLGSGIIVNGRLLTGAHGMAGELGHVNVYPEGRRCNCGLNGCLETYVSATGIKRTIFELLSEKLAPSPLRNISFNELVGEQIADAAIAGDEIALEAFARTAAILGSKMADTVAHLDPEAFIITGGLSKAGDILMLPLMASMEKSLFGAYRNKVRVIISSAAGDMAVLGPAALAWLHLE